MVELAGSAYHPDRIVFFNSSLTRFHRARFAAEMPLFLENTGGSLVAAAGRLSPP